MTWYAVSAIDDALEATWEFLFPVRGWRWLKLAVVVFFLGGVGGGFNVPSSTRNVDLPTDGSGGTGAGCVLEFPISRTRMRAERRRGVVTFRSRHPGVGRTPTRFRARYRPTGESFRAEAGSIEAFLVERSRFFVTRGGRSRDGRSGTGEHRVSEISRTPWRLREAKETVEANESFAAAGFDVSNAETRRHYSEGFSIDAGVPRAIDASA